MRIHGGRRGGDLDDEIEHHLAECADLLIARGRDPATARAEAERRFGDVGSVRRELEAITGVEEVGRMGIVEWIGAVIRDLGHALRAMRKNRTFALSVVATIGLGIGAAASIFAVVDALLLRPLPYRDADRWVTVSQARGDGGAIPALPSSWIPTWRDATDDVFDAWVAYAMETVVRTDGPGAEPLSVVAVTPGVETSLGIPLLLGRGFSAGDALPGSPPVAILSRAYWERMGADPDVIGRTLRLETGPVTVVGVLRGGIRFPEYGGARDLWLPLRDDFTWADRTVGRPQGLWARIAGDGAVTAVQDYADRLAEALAEQSPSDHSWKVRLVRVGAHRANPDVKRALWTLAATVAVILLVALINGANLLLVRSDSRAREMAVRMAVGGSRGAILRQLLTEGVVLGILGGAVGVALAWGTVALLRGLLPSEVVFFAPHAFAVERRTILGVVGLSLVTGTLLGLIPGVSLLLRRRPAAALGGRMGEDTPAQRRLRNWLVVAQVALSMTLLVVAGLFANSLVRLLDEDPGFDYERVALASMELSPTRYPDAAARARFLLRLEEALESRREVESATVITGSGFSFGAALQAEGEEPRSAQPLLIPHASVAPDYFSTMGTRVTGGRALAASDAATDNVIVDEDLARFLWDTPGAVGHRFRMGEDGDWMTVVGVVRELRLLGRDERRGPYQFLLPRAEDRAGTYAEVAMRTSGDPRRLISLFRATLRELDPEQAVWKLRTGARSLAEEEDKPRFLVTMMGLLAGIAVTLAAVGLYGVLAYSVGRRTRELGIRMALGADRGRLRVRVLREGLTVAAVGVVLGVGGALAASRSIESLLYGVGARDPVTIALTGALLLAVAAVASVMPARRAVRVDPVEVLRAE